MYVCILLYMLNNENCVIFAQAGEPYMAFVYHIHRGCSLHYANEIHIAKITIMK